MFCYANKARKMQISYGWLQARNLYLEQLLSALLKKPSMRWSATTFQNLLLTGPWNSWAGTTVGSPSLLTFAMCSLSFSALNSSEPSQMRRRSILVQPLNQQRNWELTHMKCCLFHHGKLSKSCLPKRNSCRNFSAFLLANSSASLSTRGTSQIGISGGNAKGKHGKEDDKG